MTLSRALTAEFLGTLGLTVVVVGSGIMGESLAQGNVAIALLANSLATGAGLYALIHTFGGFSGAHFNPVVSWIDFLRKRLTLREFISHSSVQMIGGLCGVLVTHAMFGLRLIQRSGHDRSDLRLVLSELLATTGLVLVIVHSGRKDAKATPTAVALYITAAYWCTSSTSFANPALTLARSLTDTFSGIAAHGVPAFILAQFAGAGLAFVLSRLILK